MYQKILVPLDGSELAECVLPHVEAIAKAFGTKDVIFVRVAQPWRMPLPTDTSFNAETYTKMESEHRAAVKKYLDKLVSRIKWAKVGVRTEVLFGKAESSIADYANKNKVDLIVIATHGRTGIGRWVMGSVADRTLHAVHVPVLIIRAPGADILSDA
jgi:nucleotide-binding universal stress UspA family protein